MHKSIQIPKQSLLKAQPINRTQITNPKDFKFALLLFLLRMLLQHLPKISSSLPPKLIQNPIKALDLLLKQKKLSPLPTEISLSQLKPLPGTVQRKRRLGRSRQAGRFCGRGNGGTKSYAGSHFSKLFEGGQVPFHLKIPKFGPAKTLEKPLVTVSLDRIQLLIDSGRLPETQPITLKTLFDAGIRPIKHGILIDAAPADRPGSFYSPRITIIASKFTPKAIAQVEASGGMAIALYTSSVSLSTLLRPDLWAKRGHLPLPRMEAPLLERDKLFWFSWANRGYLHPEMRRRIEEREDLKEFFERVDFAEPREGLLEKIAERESKRKEEMFGFDY